MPLRSLFAYEAEVIVAYFPDLVMHSVQLRGATSAAQLHHVHADTQCDRHW